MYTTLGCTVCFAKLHPLFSRTLQINKIFSFLLLPKRSSFTPSYKVKVKKDTVPLFKYAGRKRNRRVHVCGLAATGALGVAHLAKPKGSQVPQHCKNAPYHVRLDYVSMADCGYGFTVFASHRLNTIKVWCCGVNSDSQIGFHKNPQQSPRKNEVSKPHLVRVIKPSDVPLPLTKPEKTRVTGVACGRAHTLILTDRDGVFAMGNNAHGQCGRPIIDGEIYEGSKKVRCISHDNFSSPVTQVHCGLDHSLFITDKGELFACGWGADGQTGLETYEATCEPMQVKGDLNGERIIKVSSHADTTLALSDKNEVFGWGNSEYRQLECVTDDSQLSVPQKLPFDEFGKIVDIAAGGTACMILNEDGEVFVWGYGILGKGPSLQDTSWPSKIPDTLFGRTAFNESVKVTKIACGRTYFAAITNRGDLFTWGKNKHGCLGIGHNRDQFFPWKIVVGAEVTNVFCGADHTVILSKTLA